MEIATVVDNNVEDVDGGSNVKFSGKINNTSGAFFEVLNARSGLASIANRQEYEKRLLTFNASTFYAKPPCLSPLFCARFGWQNADKDMLVCSSCSSALAITLNSKLSANTFDKLCQAYRNKIVSCHETSCPFRLSSTQQIRSLEATEEELDNVEKKKRESNVEQVRLIVPVYMGQALPEDAIRLMEHPTPSIILRKNAQKLSDMIQSSSCVTNSSTNKNMLRFPRLQIPSKIRQMNSTMKLTKILGCDDESILALSLLGWNPIPNAALDEAAPVVSLGCSCCLSIMDLQLEHEHQIGNDKGSAKDNNENETDRLSKRQRISSRNLNPLEAHRHYCPYKVGFPEKAADINPVWKIILKRLCEEKHDGKIEKSTTIEEMTTDIAVGVLDKSVDNVRRILRAGIATRKIDLMV